MATGDLTVELRVIIKVINSLRIVLTFNIRIIEQTLENDRFPTASAANQISQVRKGANANEQSEHPRLRINGTNDNNNS